MVARLVVHPAFYRRMRHYRDRIGVQDTRPRSASRFVHARRGHSARFETHDLAVILRVPVPGFTVFALFYRWDGQTLTLLTLEHTAQDLPARIAATLSA